MNSITLEHIRPRIVALNAIPTIPSVIQPLLKMLETRSEAVDLHKVKELISYDKAIAAQCLRVANSPLFGHRSVETLTEAIVVLGLKRVHSIVLSCYLNNMVPPNKWLMNPTVFWRHALGCALVSRKIAELIHYEDPEKAYMAGLLHDLGILVHSMVCGDEFRSCLEQARASGKAIDRVETERLGFTHADSGEILAKSWHIPSELCEVIASHHRVQPAAKASPLVSLVYLSDLLCRLRDMGYGYYEAMAVDFADEAAGWGILIENYPRLKSIDWARLSLDVEAGIEGIVKLVDTVFAVRA
jgi:HD-like signal output (HDOD) protein